MKKKENCYVNNGKNIINSYIGKNCEIDENCVIINSVIMDEVKIYSNSKLKNCKIGNNTVIETSNLVDTEIGNDCEIGPFARTRQGVRVKDNCKIGNFVEVKNSEVGNNTKVAHLAYIGDAKIGNGCNIGCGVVFVNYNGKIKQKTIVKDNSFIGCNCNLIAPLVIEKNTYICAGTTVTDNVNEFDFVIGRKKQLVKQGLAKKYLKEIIDD